jgi:toxin YoeB
MKLTWSSHAWEDYLYWQETDRETLARINDLIKEAKRTPFAGMGKPEPLRRNLSGWWSRRITGTHRLVYRVKGKGEEQVLEVLQCRWHYDD